MTRFEPAVVLSMAMTLLALPWTSAGAGHGVTTKVSTAPSGGISDGNGRWAALAGDGSHVAFTSEARNLVAGDTNGVADVFVRNLQTGLVIRASVASDGSQANGVSNGRASVSGDGRYVAFVSGASNLVDGDVNEADDIFVRDLKDGRTVRASLTDSGEEGKGADFPSISADGRYVAFHSLSPLVPEDTNGAADVYVRDLVSHRTHLASVADDGHVSRGNSYHPSISGDGSRVSFETWGDRLAPGDPPQSVSSIYVRDLRAGRTYKASITNPGAPDWDAPGHSIFSTISANGRFVAFSSTERLVPHPVGAFQLIVTDLESGYVEVASVSNDGSWGNTQTWEGPSLSADGRYVAFFSDATNLVENDTNNSPDVFVRDRLERKTFRVSVSTGGRQSATPSEFPSISWNGRLVAFDSRGPMLAPGDADPWDDVFLHDRGAAAPCGSGAWPEGPVSGTLITLGDPSTPAGGDLASRACLLAEGGL